MRGQDGSDGYPGTSANNATNIDLVLRTNGERVILNEQN